RAFRAGYAEVVKYGLINDAGFFAWLETNWHDVFARTPARERAIATSCRAKAAIIVRDELETGERALLNLGHTFGHALEAAAGLSRSPAPGRGHGHWARARVRVPGPPRAAAASRGRARRAAPCRCRAADRSGIDRGRPPGPRRASGSDDPGQEGAPWQADV